jgi:hypothetical protein
MVYERKIKASTCPFGTDLRHPALPDSKAVAKSA